MTRFRYKALNSAGELAEGEIEAASEQAAVAQLRESGHLPISFVESARDAAAAAQGGLFSRYRRLSHKQLVIFTRELARLIGAGVSLDRSLSILATVSDHAVERDLITRLIEDIRSGGTFADAIRAQGAPFGRLYINMVKAGEEGGALTVVLERLAEYLEKSREFRANIGAALIYPAILLVVSLLSLILLLTLVVPQFQRMFAEAGAALPLPTQIVIAVADWLQAYWWTLLLAALLLLLTIPKLLTRPGVKLRWDAFVLSLAGVGPLVRKIEVARFCRTLATLLSNGVVLLTALAIVKETLGNLALAGSVERIASSLKGGGTFSGPMLEDGVFPKLACHMVRVGEETGSLDQMLLDVADIYDKEVSQSLKKLLNLLEPLMILTLGVLIAAIIFSILLALLSINELAF
ncbi:MAG: type II secretion system F family protein [Chromatiaceae bacterium]|nr:type II secretion system F family protein [Gammaproteobacteria bacterium]MCP5445758.1 type II secretion system F family protein [Chromatiaceae bacterium]